MHDTEEENILVVLRMYSLSDTLNETKIIQFKVLIKPAVGDEMLIVLES